MPSDPAQASPPLPRSALTRWWIWLTYAVLFGTSIPWYLPTGALDVWMGLPAWVVISLAAMTAAAAFTAFVIWRYWPEDEEAAPSAREERS